MCQLLERHVCLPDTKTGKYEAKYLEKEVFVKQALHVPSLWIHYAKVCMSYYLKIKIKLTSHFPLYRRMI